MTRRASLLRAALALLILAVPLAAVQPDERLDDPALEARARALGAELRCLVCQNETIDGSNAPLARDLRLALRARLSAGDSDAEALEWLRARYGDFVLYRPRWTLGTALLWLGPWLLLAAGALVVARTLRRPAVDVAREGGGEGGEAGATGAGGGLP